METNSNKLKLAVFKRTLSVAGGILVAALVLSWGAMRVAEASSRFLRGRVSSGRRSLSPATEGNS